MLKKYFLIFFTALFFATIIAPTVLILVDDTIDISFILDASEEEEKKEKDKNSEFKVFVFYNYSNLDDLVSSEVENNLMYTFKKYTKPHLNLIIPPPEFII